MTKLKRYNVGDAEMRESFEAWFSDDWQHPRAVERDAVGYKLAAAQSAWTAWQAAWQAALAAAQQPADDEVVFIDGVGAVRSSIKACCDGVQWIMVGDRVYWPLSDSDVKRLQSACCGNGSFDGPATPASEGEQQ